MNTNTYSPHRRVVGVLVAALLLGACAKQASQGSGAAGPTTTLPTPSSATSTTVPSDSHGVAEVKVTGTVQAGVEPGCRLLVPPSGNPKYLLLGGNPKQLTAGAKVTVVGRLAKNEASYCMQGTYLRVVSVTAAG